MARKQQRRLVLALMLVGGAVFGFVVPQGHMPAVTSIAVHVGDMNPPPPMAIKLG